MKKTKILALIAALLLAAMLLASCGGSTLKITDLIDKKATLPAEQVLGKGELLSNLTAASYQTYSGNLIYFTAEKEEGTKTYDQHIIYDAANNKIVATLTETDTTDLTVTLKYDSNDNAYFQVNTTTWTLDADQLPDVYTHTTALYDGAGAKVAEATYVTTAVSICDLAYFDGKIYRVGDGGTLTYAFDYSPLASKPEIDVKVDDYYYSFAEGEYVAVYDSELNFVSRYNLPAYAHDEEVFVLENGDVMVQYLVELEADATDYSFITDDIVEIEGEFGAIEGDVSFGLKSQTKYQMVTLVVDAEKGTAKEVKCDYYLLSVSNMEDMTEELAEYGVKADKIAVWGVAIKIENGRLPELDDIDEESDDVCMVLVDNKGNVSELEKLNGESVYFAAMAADDRWIVTTTENEYLINGKGEILGNISNATDISVGYMRCDGKIYDYDMNVLYDYRAAKLSYEDWVGGSLIFENEDDEVLLYTGGNSTTTIVSKDSDLSLYHVGSNYYVIKDMSAEDVVKYHFYNEKGTLLVTVESNSYFSDNSYYSDFESRGYFDDVKIIETKNADGESVFYRFG